MATKIQKCCGKIHGESEGRSSRFFMNLLNFVVMNIFGHWFDIQILFNSWGSSYMVQTSFASLFHDIELYTCFCNFLQARDFRTQGTKVRWKMRFQNMKIKLIVPAIIITLILIIVLSVCRGFKCHYSCWTLDYWVVICCLTGFAVVDVISLSSLLILFCCIVVC